MWFQVVWCKCAYIWEVSAAFTIIIMYPNVGGSTVLRNVHALLPATQHHIPHRTQQSLLSVSWSWEHQISLTHSLLFSGKFIAAVFITSSCSFFAVLVLVFVVYNRRREAHIKYPGPDDDVRENIINYDDEGGGEDDMTAFDITPLQIPIGGPVPEMPAKLPCKYHLSHDLCRGILVLLNFQTQSL